jgi:hypothetical protein
MLKHEPAIPRVEGFFVVFPLPRGSLDMSERCEHYA